MSSILTSRLHAHHSIYTLRYVPQADGTRRGIAMIEEITSANPENPRITFYLGHRLIKARLTLAKRYGLHECYDMACQGAPTPAKEVTEAPRPARQSLEGWSAQDRRVIPTDSLEPIACNFLSCPNMVIGEENHMFSESCTQF